MNAPDRIGEKAGHNGEKIIRAACPHDCPDTCAMLVTVKDGVATKIQGDPSMPFTDGPLCTKVAHYMTAWSRWRNSPAAASATACPPVPPLVKRAIARILKNVPESTGGAALVPLLSISWMGAK